MCSDLFSWPTGWLACGSMDHQSKLGAGLGVAGTHVLRNPHADSSQALLHMVDQQKSGMESRAWGHLHSPCRLLPSHKVDRKCRPPHHTCSKLSPWNPGVGWPLFLTQTPQPAIFPFSSTHFSLFCCLGRFLPPLVGNGMAVSRLLLLPSSICSPLTLNSPPSTSRLLWLLRLGGHITQHEDIVCT